MPRYLIERDLAGAGSLGPDDLCAIAERSNDVLRGMAGRAQWVQSFVTEDKIVCLYLADDPEALREHGRTGDFPVTAIHRVVEVIDPTTAEREAAIR